MIDYAKLQAYERIRLLARNLADQMKLSVGEDAYQFVGSMNDVEDLTEALSDFDGSHRT